MRSGRFSRGAVVDAAVYAVAIALFLLFFGRFFGLPFFLAAIVSPSMEPAIRVGDVVLVQRGVPYGVGDVVMWCSSPFYCVVHRVVEVGVNYVITKGDANPVPDLPVRSSSVVGKVVAIIPREAIIAAVAVILGVQLWRKRRSILRPADPVSFMVYGLIGFLALSIVTLLFFPAPSVFEVREFKEPSVSMLSTTYDNGSVVLRYRVVDTALIEILSCGVGAPGVPQTACSGDVIGPDAAVVEVPPEVLAELNEKGVSKFWVGVVASLAKNGTLKGNYTAVFSASRLAIRVTNDSLVIRNPNPFPIPYNLTIMFTNDVRWETNTTSGYLEGLSTEVVHVGDWRRVWYGLTYTLMGKEVEVSGWVRGG